MQTIWLLDFDNVINANKAGWSAQPLSTYAYADGAGWKIRWEPKLIVRIRRIHTAGVLIFWASSWCGHTDQLERILKLPQLFSAGRTGMSDDEKMQAAADVIDSGGRLIWTDDEVVPDSGELFDKLTKNNRALLIRPKSTGKHQGLRPEHLDEIDNFIKD